jgi:thiamine-monophosphate kinase
MDHDRAHPTVGEVGEWGLIGHITAQLPQGDQILIGPGDDAAVVRFPDGQVVATTDLAVEGIHFRREWSSAYEVGIKIAAANLADCAAMGARATALLIGLAAPAELPLTWASECAEGIRDEAARVGASVVGGDTVKSDRLMISITALGSLDARSPVTRSGARAGDRVLLSGPVGGSAAGLALLLADQADVDPDLVRQHRAPQPDHEMGPRLAQAGATAMCDVSDGLLADLGHIARASGVRIRLDSEKFSTAALSSAATALEIDPLIWFLAGGEDHVLVATLPRQSTAPEGVLEIGEVVEGDPGVEVPGVDLASIPKGFDHF